MSITKRDSVVAFIDSNAPDDGKTADQAFIGVRTAWQLAGVEVPGRIGKLLAKTGLTKEVSVINAQFLAKEYTGSVKGKRADIIGFASGMAGVNPVSLMNPQIKFQTSQKIDMSTDQGVAALRQLVAEKIESSRDPLYPKRTLQRFGAVIATGKQFYPAPTLGG